jgi:endonuclease/exonuclease/phosphatase family metal-dependent hydrolase
MISFSVMTWNVENLFRPDHPSGFGPRDQQTYERKLSNLARTIQAVAPDVIALQEIGDEDAFGDLRRALSGRYPYGRLSRLPDMRGIRVAFLSRLPLLQARDIGEMPPEGLVNVPSGDSGSPIRSMGRGILKATVVLAPGLLVNVVNVHLKSKLITYPNGRRFPLDENERVRYIGYALLRRAAEAAAVRVLMNELMTGNNEPAVLMGDFNDSPEAVTTQMMLGPADRSLAHRDRFDDIRLYNLADYIPAARRFSRIYLKARELIDHITVSHELIFYLRQADSIVEPIESIDASVDSRRDAVYPDHAALFARFEIPDEEADRHFSITRPL